MRTWQILRGSIDFILRWRTPQPGDLEQVRDDIFATMVANGVDPDEARKVAAEMAEADSELAAAIADCRPQAERARRAMEMIEELADRMAREGDEE
jgi:hypothetical protein